MDFFHLFLRLVDYLNSEIYSALQDFFFFLRTNIALAVLGDNNEFSVTSLTI